MIVAGPAAADLESRSLWCRHRIGVGMPSYEIDGVVPIVAAGAFVHPSAVLIGDVVIETDCYIGPAASIRGDFGSIVITSGSNVQDGCVLHSFPGRELLLERESHIGHGAVLHGCVIESGAMVGMNAVVMDGARVGARAFVGAGSVVRAEMVIPAEHLAVGNPVTEIRPLDAQTLRWKANGVKVYQELAKRSLTSMRETVPLTEIPADRPRLGTGREVSAPLHELRRGDGPRERT
ncbi:gamma carbonic anhydrase family protein [Nocardia sp. NPDC088792]|uniref:gamma carbonic anhydrase family protein n=1 Tax=Nocardia sp. NPDC088792 TaxID=3364332 RepID=UPI00382C7D1A